MSADWTSLPRPQLEQLRARARHWTSPTPRRALHLTGRWLERRGFELLGKGVHARVFHHRGDRRLVLKVFSTHNAAGRATLLYLKRALAMGHPMMPAVYRIYRIGPVAVVAMERLVTKSAGVLNRTAKALDLYFEEESFLMREFWDIDLVPSSRPVPAWQSKSVTLEQIAFLCDVLSDIYAKVPGCGFDMHAGNFMFRSLGKGRYQLVLTDPMC